MLCQLARAEPPKLIRPTTAPRTKANRFIATPSTNRRPIERAGGLGRPLRHRSPPATADPERNTRTAVAADRAAAPGTTRIGRRAAEVRVKGATGATRAPAPSAPPAPTAEFAAVPSEPRA